MKWIEVINTRSTDPGLEASVEELLSSIPEEYLSNGLVEAKIYRHSAMETDWGVHLRWNADRVENGGSALGLSLARTLKEFGLVNYSVWVEKEEI